MRMKNDFHIKSLSTYPHFETEARRNLEMAYWACEVGDILKKNFLDNIYEYSTERQECKTFCDRIPFIGHYPNEQLGLFDIFNTSNLPSVPLNPFLFKPHFYFVPACIYYSNYVCKSTFNATPVYNVMTLLNLILLSIESYREFKCR